MEKMTIEKARENMTYWEHRGIVTNGVSDVASFYNSKGFIEGYESRDAEIDFLLSNVAFLKQQLLAYSKETNTEALYKGKLK